MDNPDNTQLTAQCLCKTHTFTTTVPRLSLPLEATACHCTSCRHVTGTLFSMNTAWTGDHDAIRRSSLKQYAFSETLTVHFCATCSSPMFWDFHHSTQGRDITVFTGVLRSDEPKDLLKLTNHICVEDTRDGGATMWMREPNGDGVEAKRWAGRIGTSEELPRDWPGQDALHAASWKNDVEELALRCHCNGVDLVYRRRQALEEYAGAQPAELPRFVDPVSRKPVVEVDACDSCRLSFGVDFSYWTFLSLPHLGFASSTQSCSGDPAPDFPATVQDLHTAVATAQDARDPRFGTLAVYDSADGAKRYFCARCSACVFYAADGKRDVVQVAMGLFDAPEGARVEGTCRWLLGDSLDHREDVVGTWREGWVKAVEAGSEAWRVERKT